MSYPLREMMRRQGLTMRRLSESLGVARVTVQRWVKGERGMSKSTRTLMRLIDLHGLDALLSGELGASSQRKPLNQSNKCNASKPSEAGPE